MLFERESYKIGFLEVLFANDTRFHTILLHEPCHTKHHNHKVSFGELLDAKLKEASIIDKDDGSRKNGWKSHGSKLRMVNIFTKNQEICMKTPRYINRRPSEVNYVQNIPMIRFGICV
jgi:hypothetical protein